eukprot:gnl/TRDRNA2_/TRDRNA2_163037_c1_seq2.p1 gnl/TRDRNA2_/TRDRNA2_163037_c1~~gnl/TRDRNA2_/TRDRNA2_163037_c1_seq2.p1  ORF type:complete len:111 (+),score=23.47 gnl/TRDRNA2_/TRDRNA2_163037_c1_seq2:188-520(+)
MNEFNARTLAETAWAFASVNLAAEKCWTAMASTAERMIRDFKAQEVANTAWAVSTVTLESPDQKLFGFLINAAQRQLSKSKSQEIANTAWALATVQWPNADLFAALATSA